MPVWIESEFLQNAILACIFGGASLGAAGVFVALLDIPFVGVCMSHAAFLGAVVAVLTGANPMLCALLTCAAAGALVGPLAERSQTTANAVLSITFTGTVGLALLLLSFVSGPRAEAMNLIWGSILTISRAEVGVLLLAALALLAAVLCYYRKLAAVLYHREIAASVGVPANFVYYGIIFGTGVLISANLNIVGGLLIFALLVNPANAAAQCTYRLRTMLVLAALFGVASCCAGLYFSYLFDVPTGAVIALTSTGIFLIALLFSPKRRA